MSARLDYAVGGEAGYTGADAWGVMPGDWNDTAQMQSFAPGPAASEAAPWWQGVIAYGLTRAIDNRFAPAPVAGNTYPGSFAGQNGTTYTNGNAPIVAGGGGGLLLLIAAGALVFALAS